MKKTLAIAITAGLVLVGCSSTNKQQVFNITTIHGAGGKIGIPLGSSESLGMLGFFGYAQIASGINPTGSNINSAPLSFVAHSRNKQTLNAVSTSSTSTNANGNITEGSDDSMIISAGPADVNDASTNRNTVISAKQ